MRHLVLVILAVLGIHDVSPQCFSDNDRLTGEFDTNLSGLTDFGFDLYRQMSPQGNIFFSPYSIWSAFGLTYLGAAGNTERQLQQALGMIDKSNTYKLIKAPMFNSQELGVNYTFTTANRIYYNSQPTFSLRTCVREHLQDFLQLLDMSDTTAAASDINTFVSQATKNRINDVITSDDLVDAQMVLINAVFFKGMWQHQFKTSETRPMNFRVTPNSPPHSVSMMSQNGKMKYGVSTDLGARILELPYSGNVISMFLMLPEREGEAAWAKMVNSLSARNFQLAMDSTRRRDVDLFLPKFKMEQTVPNLIQGMENLGVTNLFDAQYADLSRFSQTKLLYVSKAVHKAFVEVSEEGTEAAGATVMRIVQASASSRESRTITFNCDRPFIFVIRDNKTKNLMFMGAYRDPSA